MVTNERSELSTAFFSTQLRLFQILTHSIEFFSMFGKGNAHLKSHLMRLWSKLHYSLNPDLLGRRPFQVDTCIPNFHATFQSTWFSHYTSRSHAWTHSNNKLNILPPLYSNVTNLYFKIRDLWIVLLKRHMKSCWLPATHFRWTEFLRSTLLVPSNLREIFWVKRFAETPTDSNGTCRALLPQG